jgi:hypothetical protein
VDDIEQDSEVRFVNPTIIRRGQLVFDTDPASIITESMKKSDPDENNTIIDFASFNSQSSSLSSHFEEFRSLIQEFCNKHPVSLLNEVLVQESFLLSVKQMMLLKVPSDTEMSLGWLQFILEERLRVLDLRSLVLHFLSAVLDVHTSIYTTYNVHETSKGKHSNFDSKLRPQIQAILADLERTKGEVSSLENQ